MVMEIRPHYPTEWAALKAVAAKLGIGAAETVRTWVRKAEVDAGQRPGTTSEEAAEIKRLRAENAELRRANEILKTASAFFAVELDRPAVEALVAFIDAHGQVFEVERSSRSTGPNRSDRRCRGKDDTLDAENAAHAALAGNRVITPKTLTGMVESLRVLRIVRSTAVKVRRVALQMLRCQIISAPEELRDRVRNLTGMQLMRTCAAWRPDETAFRDSCGLAAGGDRVPRLVRPGGRRRPRSATPYRRRASRSSRWPAATWSSTMRSPISMR
jgi:transposase